MATYTRIERRQRGPIGHAVKWTFIGFNILMLIWIVAGTSAAIQGAPTSGAGRAGAVIGTAIGASFVFVLWALGDIILGILVLLTRGDRVLVEERPAFATSNSMETAPDTDATIRRMLQERSGASSPEQQRYSSAPVTSPPVSFGKRR